MKPSVVDKLESSTSADQATTAMERSRLYGLLAHVFREEPDATFLNQLRSGDFLSISAESGLDFGEDLMSEPVEALCESLALEYSRLFLGPGHHISPHESVQLEQGSGSLWGEETVLVKRFIEATGINYDSEFNGIPDHVSVELEFLSKLAANEAHHWQHGDEQAARNVAEWQQDFISRHASQWIPGFCRKVMENAGSTFYIAFAGLLIQFLETEAEAQGVQ